MKINVYTLCYNEKPIAKWAIDYWKKCNINHIFIYDNGSDDGCLDIFKEYPEWITIRDFKSEGFNDFINIAIKNQEWKECRGNCDFVWVCDFDEIPSFENFEEELEKAKKNNADIIKTQTHLLCSENFPEYSEDKFLEEQTRYVIDNTPKTFLFNPNTIEDSNYTVGAHSCNMVKFGNEKINEYISNIHAIHAKKLGYDYLLSKTQMLKDRLSKLNLKNGWGIHYLYNKEKIFQELKEDLDKSIEYNNSINKYSVLTYIFGDYDKVKEIKEKSNNAEYILVTDNPNLTSSTWEIKYIQDLEGKSVFEKCYEIRFNPFKYVSNNIVLRIDGNVEIKKNLDYLINTFINGNYEISLMIHPERNNLVQEYLTWVKCRNYDIEQAKKIISTLQTLGYDMNYKGLYQGTFVIQRKDKTNMLINNFILNLLKYLRKEDIERLDQTITSAVINKMFNGIKVLPVGEELITNSDYFQWYIHNSDNKIPFKTNTIEPYLFNTLIQTIKF